MSIRLKFIFVVLPLMVVGLVIGGVAAFYSASNGITRVAVEFFEFKVTELDKYIEGQWRLLVDNDLSSRPDMVQAAQAGIEVYAKSIIRSETEIIFVVDAEGNLVLSTAANAISDPEKIFQLSEKDIEAILARAETDSREFQEVQIDGQERVTMGFSFTPFSWYVMVSESRAVFYQDIDRITTQTVFLVIISSVVMVILLFLFTGIITRPLLDVGGVMKKIITTNDFESRVPIQFKDEIGQLSNTFNIMIEELDSAYGRIKKYAFNAAVAQKKESKIRNIFQKYVPQDLINQFFANPDSMLVGQSKDLAVLFSDIRSFTSISERMKPDELVSNLNRYFQYMVDIIMNREGVIDKYIGDAIMAFFGAPVHHDNDALQSVLTGIEMIEAVRKFNQEQEQLGKPAFNIGVGINYGPVTVGNIGTDKKLDYTVIGDSVNVASRLEGLTKYFRQEVLIGESLYKQVKKDVLCRIVGKVAVKGKQEGLGVYTVAKKSAPSSLKDFWNEHNKAMLQFYSREFAEARSRFVALSQKNGKDDYLVLKMIQECDDYIATPPPKAWTGIEIMKTK